MNRDTAINILYSVVVSSNYCESRGAKMRSRTRAAWSKTRSAQTFFAFYILCRWLLYGKLIGATKNFFALLPFTEILHPWTTNAENWKNMTEASLFQKKGLNYFEAEWITYGCICAVRKEEWKDCCDFVDIEYQTLISRSVTRWLPLYRSLPRMLQLYPASNSYFMSSMNTPTVVQKRFLEILWANSVHIKTFTIICGCFYWASSEYWEVKSISCWGCIVFRHCEGKDSRETIRCTYQAKLNEH